MLAGAIPEVLSPGLPGPAGKEWGLPILLGGSWCTLGGGCPKNTFFVRGWGWGRQPPNFPRWDAIGYSSKEGGRRFAHNSRVEAGKGWALVCPGVVAPKHLSFSSLFSSFTNFFLGSRLTSFVTRLASGDEEKLPGVGAQQPRVSGQLSSRESLVSCQVSPSWPLG
jgi:hypothetical protein